MMLPFNKLARTLLQIILAFNVVALKMNSPIFNYFKVVNTELSTHVLSDSIFLVL